MMSAIDRKRNQEWCLAKRRMARVLCRGYDLISGCRQGQGDLTQAGQALDGKEERKVHGDRS